MAYNPINYWSQFDQKIKDKFPGGLPEFFRSEVATYLFIDRNEYFSMKKETSKEIVVIKQKLVHGRPINRKKARFAVDQNLQTIYYLMGIEEQFIPNKTPIL